MNMTVRNLLKVLNTDEFYMIHDATNDYEIIRAYEKGSHRALKQYYDCEVESVTPTNNAVEIRYTKPLMSL